MTNYLAKIHPRSLAHLSRHLQALIKGKLWVKILIGMGLGLIVGLLISPDTGLFKRETAQIIGSWLAMPGNIFLGLIQMVVMPLVFASVIRGIASGEDVEYLKRIGTRLVGYFIFTTTVAIIIGIGITLLIQPGTFIDADLAPQAEAPEITMEEAPDTIGLEGLPDVVVQLLPENPLGAMVERQMLHVVLFAVFIGLALISMPPKQAKPLLELMGSLQEVAMTVVRWAMVIAPLAVFGLLAQITIKVGLDAMLGMAVYVGTVILGLMILLVFYLFLANFIGKTSPRKFMGAAREVQLLAFSTSSSAAVMPLTIKTAIEKLKVRPSTAQFLIPLGTTINMDGTALYQGAATVFLAQVFGIELSIPTLLLIVVTAVGASIGSPATPGVGIVILAMVLQSAGIPTSGIALILGVDRILDMSRTALNVSGDLTASLVLDRWVGGKKSFEQQKLEEDLWEEQRKTTGDEVICDE